MGWRIEWTRTSLRDLESIHNYIALDSPRYAAITVDRINKMAESLELFPRGGAIVREFDREDIRQKLVGNYRLIYHLVDDRIVILGVIHGARDLIPLWSRENRTPP